MCVRFSFVDEVTKAYFKMLAHHEVHVRNRRIWHTLFLGLMIIVPKNSASNPDTKRL
jgi:hypothetical protein